MRLRLVEALLDLARIGARRADEGDAPALDDDLPILVPGARVHVEKAPDPQGLVGGALAERGEHQILADADLVVGVDQVVVLHRASSKPGTRTKKARGDGTRNSRMRFDDDHKAGRIK